MPRVNAYRAIYPGPQRQASAQTPSRTKRGAMGYSEIPDGSIEQYEAVESTVMNRVASGHKYWVDRGADLSEGNVIAATEPQQYLGVGRSEYKKYLDGQVNNRGARNAEAADQNLRRTGKPTTDATSFIVHRDGSPPSDEEIFRLGHVVYVGKVGRVYLYKDTAPPAKK